MAAWRRIATHPGLALAFRLLLGGVFVTASISKINFAAEFAETVASYRLVPALAVNLVAVGLPWLELVCGLMLAAGVRVRAAALVVAALLAAFGLAILVNLLRGSPIGCGCFQNTREPMTWLSLVRDLAWMGMALHVYRYDAWLQVERAFMVKYKEISACESAP